MNALESVMRRLDVLAESDPRRDRVLRHFRCESMGGVFVRLALAATESTPAIVANLEEILASR